MGGRYDDNQQDKALFELLRTIREDVTCTREDVGKLATKVDEKTQGLQAQISAMSVERAKETGRVEGRSWVMTRLGSLTVAVATVVGAAGGVFGLVQAAR